MKEQIGRRVRRRISALISMTMLFTAASAFPAKAASDCVIDTSVTYQTIRGFGGINLPEWISQGDMTDAQVQKAFGNGEDELGFTILRIYVSDDSNAWKTAVPTAKRAQALGATVFASPWNPPSNARNNGGGGKYSMSSDKFAAYATHLNNYIKYMEGQGIDLYSVSVQNEPDYASEWTYWSTTDIVNFIAQYGSKVKEGTNAKLMSAESFQYRKDIYNGILGNSQAMANCDLFGTHFYGTQRSQMDFPALENCGKDIWMTEVYVPDSSSDADTWPQAIQVAENMHNGLVVGNLNAYVWWYIRRSYGPMKENGNISKRGYMMAQYSKWVRPGAVRLGTTESPDSSLLCSSYKNEDGSIAIVAINKGSGQVNQNFVLSGGEKITALDSYRSSASENIAKVTSPSFTDNSFSAQLPGNSVTTFVIGAKEAEPDPNGYFFHDTFESSAGGWSGRGSASVATSTSAAYDGSGSLAVSGREATWNGATRTLSANTFKPGQAYSFSADVMYNTGDDTETFHLTLEYKGSDGETHYDKIVEGVTVPKGQWVQLANPSYTIPTGATSMQIYIETEPNKNNFFIDEAIGAPEGTQIEGPGAPAVITRKRGDVDGDGKINAKDLTLAKRIVLGKLTDSGAKKAADVDGNGAVEMADLVWYVKYLTGEVKDFPEEQQSTTPGGEQSGSTSMRTITTYTNAVKDSLVMTETSDSKQKKAGVTYPQITKEQYFSKKANKNKPYNIMLPANHDSSKKYPVLYLLHGYYENEDRMILTGNETPIPTPQIITNAIAEGAAKEMIVVVPFVFTSATMNGPSGMNDQSNAAYDAFVDDIVDSLMPHIESKYSVATGKANTAVTGFSMGGRESLLIGMKYADKFGYIGAICPAPGVTGQWKWASEEAAPSLILLTGGTNDDVVGLNTPQGYHNNLDSAGTPHLWHVVQGGYHGDNCIRAHIYNFVRMIFKA